MINRTILFQAKSFLCWDKCPGMSIKLVPIQESVAFFYPPLEDDASVILFYNTTAMNLTNPLCFLFHEAGHYWQWVKARRAGKLDDFNKMIQLDKGEDKVDFEREAWIFGQEMLVEFLKKENIGTMTVLAQYFKLMSKSLETYND